MAASESGPRLAFVTGHRVAVHDGRLHADPGLGRALDILSARHRRFTLVAPTTPMSSRLTHTLQLDLSSYLPLPAMPSILAGNLQALRVHKVLKTLRGTIDVAIVQLAFPATPALWAMDVPVVFHVYGDPIGLARDAGKYQGLARFPALLAAVYVDRMQRLLVRRPRARLVTNGEAMLRRYGIDRGRAVVSSTLHAHEVGSVSRSRPTDAPFRILFAGYMRPEKGVDTLLEAYELVLRELPEAELHLVGPGELSALGNGVEALARDLAARGTIVRHGAQPFGPELFQSYADADVLALPTRSEGTPRVLVEARAFGCPVVSTTVGGIPFSVTNGLDGLLVRPNDAAQLAAAILSIHSDGELRDRLRSNGYERARATTVEAFAGALADELANVLRATVGGRA